jgi:hypothetical protein
MLRLLVQYVLPLILPFLAYLAYLALTGGRTPGWLAAAPWPALLAGGVALLAASLVLWTMTVGAPPGERYVPAHLEDGRIVPATTVPPGEAAPGAAPDG